MMLTTDPYKRVSSAYGAAPESLPGYVKVERQVHPTFKTSVVDVRSINIQSAVDGDVLAPYLLVNLRINGMDGRPIPDASAGVNSCSGIPLYFDQGATGGESVVRYWQPGEYRINVPGQLMRSVGFSLVYPDGEEVAYSKINSATVELAPILLAFHAGR